MHLIQTLKKHWSNKDDIRAANSSSEFNVLQVYRDQIEFCVAAVAAARQSGDATLPLPDATLLSTTQGASAKSGDPAFKS